MIEAFNTPIAYFTMLSSLGKEASAIETKVINRSFFFKCFIKVHIEVLQFSALHIARIFAAHHEEEEECEKECNLRPFEEFNPKLLLIIAYLRIPILLNRSIFYIVVEEPSEERGK